MTGRDILLLAHGTPDSPDQMEEYLTQVRGGRPPSPELVAEMRHRYDVIGGRSPLTEITLAQAAALRAALGGATPVHVGMRHWHPSIGDALRRAADQGVMDLLAIPMAPQYSTFILDAYCAATKRATPAGMRVRFVAPWHDHPLLIEAFAERIREALDAAPRQFVLFTAHSLPERVIRDGDPYLDRVRATVRAVAARAGLIDHDLAYQSAGRTAEPWLGPTVEERLARLAQEGVRSALVVPVSFVCDCAEVLYDIDVRAREAAERLGIDLARVSSINTSDTFIRALVDLILRNG